MPIDHPIAEVSLAGKRLALFERRAAIEVHIGEARRQFLGRTPEMRPWQDGHARLVDQPLAEFRLVRTPR